MHTVCMHAAAGAELCRQEVRRLTARALWLAVCAAGPCKFEVHEEDLQFEPLKTEWDALPEGDRAKSGPCFSSCTENG